MMQENGSRPGGANGRAPLASAWPRAGVGAPPTAVRTREAVPRRVFATIGFVLDATRRRRSGRMILWTLVLALALGGVGLLSYPIVTDVWAQRIQSGLEEEFQAITPEQGRTLYQVQQIKEGQALTYLRIPKLKVKVVVVEGVSGNALRAGVGHFPQSQLPGEPGNVAIAGHRTGFGEPFRHVDRLKAGDRIELQTPFGPFVYAVMDEVDGHANPWVTHAADWTVIKPTPQPSLTLVTCDPPGTSKNRLIVRARLVSSPTEA